MESFVETIKQYAAKEQAELRVRVNIPGTWHGFHNLTQTERGEEYEAEAHVTGWLHTASPKRVRARRRRARPSSSCANPTFSMTLSTWALSCPS